MAPRSGLDGWYGVFRAVLKGLFLYCLPIGAAVVALQTGLALWLGEMERSALGVNVFVIASQATLAGLAWRNYIKHGKPYWPG